MADFGISQFLTSEIVIPPAGTIRGDMRSTSSLISTRTVKGIISISRNILGTLRWCAHEQFAVGDDEVIPHTESTDIWAFGMTVFVSSAFLSDMLTRW